MHNRYPHTRSLITVLSHLIIAIPILLLGLTPAIEGQSVALAAATVQHSEGLSSLPAALPFCPTTLNFGEMIECSINAAAEVDTYTFAAKGGDKVNVRMTRTSDTLRPRVRIYNPSGAEVCNAAYGNPTAEVGSCALVSDGTYTLRADDTYASNVGGYTLYIQRLNKPGNAVPIVFGQTLTGNIELQAEIHTYTFVAEGDDKVNIRMSRTSDTLRPRIRIVNAAGDQVCEAAYGNPTAEIGSCTLVSVGTYSILADDTYLANTGDYTLYIQRLNQPPGDARVLAFGQPITGTISTLAEQDTSTFTVGVDDKVTVRMTRTSETLRPRVRIFDPVGKQVCDAAYGDPTVEIGSCKLVRAGTYTLLADDTYLTNTGNYTLYIQRLNNPGAAQAIGFGQTLTGAISALAELDTFTFSAAVDDHVRLRMTRSSDTLRPRIRIYTPAGDELCGAAYGNPTVEIGDCLLRTAGTYTILADDTYVSNAGNYTLSLECLTATCGGAPTPPTPPMSCQKAPSGIDTCTLLPGDILLMRGNNTLNQILEAVGGTYWTHAGLYVGDQQVVEAVGPLTNDADEVIVHAFKDSPWWQDSNGSLQDWAVVRPNTSDAIKQLAITYATQKADDPAVTYNILASREDEQQVYCSQLVWKAYQQAGINLETNYGFLSLKTDFWVAPGDLYPVKANDTTRTVVQQKDIGLDQQAFRALFVILSPAHITLVDEQGRRTGYDAATGGVVNEIPGALYSGTGAEYETISVTGLVENGRIIVTGFDTGSYHLAAEYVDNINPQSQLIEGQTQPAKVETYTVSGHEGDGTAILSVSYSVYLPLTQH